MTPSPLTYARAKRMRREPTEAERRVWGALRNRSLGGFKFYRQVPIGPYIVDFVSKEFGLVVEVDGATHGDRVVFDERRTAYLESLGLQVYRIDNMFIFENFHETMDGVHRVLTERAAKGPHQSRLWRDSFSGGEA